MNGGGCGCGTAFVALLVIGGLQVAGEWIGRHPLPSALIGAGVLALVAACAAVWHDGQRRRPVVLAAAPAGFCRSCGAARSPGQRFCGECGSPTG